MHFYPSPDAYSSEERQDCYILVKHLFCVYKEAVKLLIIDNQLVGVLAHLKASDIWAHKKCLSFSQVLWHILNTAQLKTYFPKTSQTITDTVKALCHKVSLWTSENILLKLAFFLWEVVVYLSTSSMLCSAALNLTCDTEYGEFLLAERNRVCFSSVFIYFLHFCDRLL